MMKKNISLALVVFGMGTLLQSSCVDEDGAGVPAAKSLFLEKQEYVIDFGKNPDSLLQVRWIDVGNATYKVCLSNIYTSDTMIVEGEPQTGPLNTMSMSLPFKTIAQYVEDERLITGDFGIKDSVDLSLNIIGEPIDKSKPSSLSKKSSVKANLHFIAAKEITLADPTIFADNGCYYLYGTSSDKGFLAYKSTDLKNWGGPCGRLDGSFALSTETSFGERWFWAPQVFKRNGKYYMAYCAASTMNTASSQIAIAEADSPLGPFQQENKVSLPADMQEIDPFVFVDDDGKVYIYHVREIDSNSIYVAQLNDDMTEMDESTTTLCLKADTYSWENTANSSWPVAEGPTVIKHDGVYYLFYSANDFRNVNYAVGYATATSPLGPWTKHPEPILTREMIQHNGPGHGDVFQDVDGRFYYVFHTHNSSTTVEPRKTAIIQIEWQDGEVKIIPSTFHYL
jgi:GH43 family beta-xylosidase